MRVLGLDIGDRRIGVAVSDPEGIMAGSLTTITRRETERDLAAIVELARKEETGLIVAGLPRSLNGSIGPQAQKVLAFVERLAEVSPVPVETWDERLSTVEADRIMGEMAIRLNKRKERRDSLAAAIILQGYLDAARHRDRS
ncbi:MAG: Holliday junction resolvase RuvX [Chloroflexi bacterium]|nr:Holliday junction resolvase RuvX [Chloroflexota bacterium]